MASATPAQALSRLNCMAEIELDTALVPEDAQVISYQALQVKRCACCKFDDHGLTMDDLWTSVD